jgi:tetratricopeptide (TPR) repeat protein
MCCGSCWRRSGRRWGCRPITFRRNVTYFDDLSDYHGRPNIKVIGWLERGHAFQRSIPSVEDLELLWNVCTISAAQTRGRHYCDLCESPTLVNVERNGVRLSLGSSEIRVFSSVGAVYAAPTMIFHYVGVHHYQPPNEFLQALREGPKPPSLEYFALLKAVDPHWNRTHTTEHTQSYREGIRVYGELAKIDPAYLPYVADCLVMLGISASHSQLPDEADQSYAEAIQILRRVAKENPTDYAHKLARTLSHFGRHFRTTLRLKEAESAYREALEVYRKVARESPDYLFFVANVLSSLEQIYNDMQRATDAVQAREEAARLRQDWKAAKLHIPWH